MRSSAHIEFDRQPHKMRQKAWVPHAHDDGGDDTLTDVVAIELADFPLAFLEQRMSSRSAPSLL